MELKGERVIPAGVEETWVALNDPVVMKQCIAGCESLERTADDAYTALVAVRVGPVSARFKGNLRLTDVQPPVSYTMHFDGQGGVAGFGKGSADVRLQPEGAEATRLDYAARAQVGGKLAQVGSRLIDGVARKMSDDFFKAFRNQLAPQETPAAAPAAPVPATPVAAAPAILAPEALPAAAVATASHAAARSEPAGFLVPAWWLGPAVSLGAFAAIAAGLLLR